MKFFDGCELFFAGIAIGAFGYKYRAEIKVLLAKLASKIKSAKG